MIILLKLLLVILCLFSGFALYFIVNQFKIFLKSNESDEVTLLNKFFIQIIAYVVILFLASTIAASIYFIFSSLSIK